MTDGDDSFANAVEYVARRLPASETRLAADFTVLDARRQLLQLVSNYRRRAPDGAAPVPICFRIFRRCDATLPGGELGAAVWFCSADTPDTFGVVVGADDAKHFEEGARFVLVPEQ